MMTTMKLGRWLAPAALLLVTAACGDDGTAEPAHRFGALECAALEGVATTGPDAMDQGIEAIRYEVVEDSGVIDLRAEAPDGRDLGTASVSFELATRELVELTTDISYVEGDVVARERTRAVVSGDVARHTTVNELGELTSTLWWTATLSGDLLSATVGVPVDAARDPESGVVQRLDGTYATLELFGDGEVLADEAAIGAFVEEHGLGGFDERPVQRRLRAIVDDEGWRTHATARIQACQGQQAAAFEEEVGLPGLGSRREELSCAKTLDVLGGISNAHSAVDTARSAASLALALGAAGAFAGGATAGAVFVAAAVTIYAAGKVIDGAVSRNGGAIVSAPLALSGDEESAAAVASFFGGKGQSTGDPHLQTHDGRAFDFQAVGEFVLVRSTSHAFELQSRQTDSPTSRCPNVSFNRAVAAQLGLHRVSYVRMGDRLRVDGVEVDLVDGGFTLDDGGGIYEAGSSLELRAPTGEAVWVRRSSSSLSLYVALPDDGSGAYEGLLGNFDGELDNDLVGVDGPLSPSPTFEQIHGTLADRWALTADGSLFDYEEGESPASFRVPGLPTAPAKIADLPDDVREAAELACVDVANPIAYDDCVLDVGCTGDEEFVELHEARNPAARVPVREPLSFDGWTQEGPPSNGIWTVAPDGRSVVQERNGDPTFFVSPDALGDVLIEGVIEPGTIDDDFVGFVFGYQGPTAVDGDDENEVDTFAVTWKGGEQAGAEEGLKLLHVHGNLETDGANDLLWDLAATGSVEALDTDLGDGRGWDAQPYRFALRYTADRIEVWFEGELRLRLDAVDSAYPFVPGRFGFYNYSQPNTTYSDFSVAPPTVDPTDDE